MAVSFPRVSRAWTSRGPRTHRVRSVVSDEFAVLDHASVHRPVSGGRRVPSPDQSPTSTRCVKGAFGVLRIPLRSTLDPLRSGLRFGAYEGTRLVWAMTLR
jgi:hypothetical protein